MALDIHNYKRKLQQERSALDKSPISARNRQAILDLVQDLVLRGYSQPRQVKYLGWLRRLAVLLGKDFHEATSDDLKKLVCVFEQRKAYSPWTRKDLRVLLKRLYCFIRLTPPGSAPEEVSWISTRISHKDINLPGEGQLLNQEEAHRLIDAATNLRDKAYLAVLWESGCRVGELGNMQVKHVTFDVHGALLSVKGKTGARQVRLISSVPYLANWMSCHPHSRDHEAPVWAVLTKKRVRALDYGYLRMILKRLAVRAGISKRIYPHLLRHSRATVLANHLTEFQMNHYFGWKQGSSMPSTYVHLSGKNIDDSLLALNGLPGTQSGAPRTEGIACLTCGTFNSMRTGPCRTCGNALDTMARNANSACSMPVESPSKDQVRALIEAVLANPDLVASLRERLSPAASTPSMNDSTRDDGVPYLSKQAIPA